MRSPISPRRAVPFLLVPLLAALALVILLLNVVSAREVPFSGKRTVCDDCTNATDGTAAGVDSNGHMDTVGVSRSDGKVFWWQNDGTAADGRWVTHTLTGTSVGAHKEHVEGNAADGQPGCPPRAQDAAKGEGEQRRNEGDVVPLRSGCTTLWPSRCRSLHAERVAGIITGEPQLYFRAAARMTFLEWMRMLGQDNGRRWRSTPISTRTPQDLHIISTLI